MRIWHYKLIPVLPRQQLLGQWRECCAISKMILQEKECKHLLVSKVTEYPAWMWMFYQHLIEKEFEKRGYDIHKATLWSICDNTMKAEEEGYFADDDSFDFMMYKDDPFPGWHNDRYLRQCYFNLQEKYDCGGITDEEWSKIENLIDISGKMMYYY